MYRNSALLSIGAALVFSLFFFGVGHAFQIEKRQGVHTLTAGEMKGTASLPIKQVSNAPIPCGGRTGALCSTNSPPVFRRNGGTWVSVHNSSIQYALSLWGKNWSAM